MACQVASGGTEHYILRNTQANIYLKLDAQDYFLWQHLDGEHSVCDLAVAYFAAYQAFPFDRLVHLLGELKAKRLLDEQPVHVLGGIAHRLEERSLAFRLQRFADTSMHKEISLRNVDRTFASVYRRLAWPLFTRPAFFVDRTDIWTASRRGRMRWGDWHASFRYFLQCSPAEEVDVLGLGFP